MRALRRARRRGAGRPVDPVRRVRPMGPVRRAGGPVRPVGPARRARGPVQPAGPAQPTSPARAASPA
ncbi:hypothetical protein BV401_28875 [Streptomyces malaysiensis subsp. malaysiensis]|uniref:Uncharacterized protein n=1 Tax=Streptomyces autolyticus TaxID=75293 RepID=A0ABM6HQE9_9ACTN|nr:hypothetical protein BV401_28875 [Streptomyces autolyticus]